MNVLEVSPERLWLLLLASVCHGAAVFVLVCVRDVLASLGPVWREERLGAAMRCPVPVTERGPRPGAILSGIAEALGDVLLCLVSAALLLCLNFLWNDGKFRLYTAVFSLVSYLLAERTLGRMLRGALVLPVRALRRMWRIVSAPAKLLLGLACRTASRLLRRAADRRERQKIRRHTRAVLSRLGGVGDNGLITRTPDG